MRFTFRVAALAAALAMPVSAQQQAPAPTAPAAPAPQQPDDKARAQAAVDQARPLAAARDWKAVRPLAEDAVKLDPDNGQAYVLLGFSLHASKKWAQAAQAFDRAAALNIEAKYFARAAAECADKRKDRARQAKYWLVAGREEKDQAAALKAAHAADAPAAQVEAYELASQLGKVPKEDLAPYARAEAAAGALQKAAPLFDQAAAANPAQVDLALEAARARLSLKDLDGAEQRVRKVYEGHPQEPGVLLLSAEIANAKGDAASERKILENLTAAQPKYEPGQLRLGKLLLAANDLAGARARFAAAVSAAPNDPEAHRLSAEAAFAAGDKDAALSEAKSAQKLAPKDPATGLILGRAAYAKEDYATALTGLEAGRKLASADALLELGDAYRRGKQYGKARGAVADALKKDAPAARAHELLGDIALADGKGAEAVKELALAQAGREKDVPFQVKQATAADLAGDTDAAASALDNILAVQPGEPRASVARAKIWRAQRNAAKAAELLLPVAEKNPKDASVQASLADARLESGDAQGAQAAAQAALDADTGNALAHDVLGRVLYNAGKRKEAEKHLETAAAAGAPSGKKGVSSGPEASGDALVALADLKLSAGQKDAAKALVDRAKKIGAARLPVIQARVLAKDGDLTGAERAISPYIGSHPDDGDALSAGADIAYDRANWALASDRFEKAMQKSGAAMTPQALGRLCDLRVKNGAYAPAKEACTQAMAGGNDAPSVHASMGLALYKTGDKAQAKSELKIAAAADKKSEDVATHAALGAIAQDEGDEKTALAEYDLVLKQKKDHVEANMATGRMLEKKGNHKEAQVRLGRAFASKTDDAQLGADLAKAQLGAGNLVGAQKTLGQIRTDELQPEVLHGLKGRVENGLGNYKKAHDEYAKALQARPNDAELLALDGENYLKLPNYDKAIASLELAAKADPSRLDVATQLTKLYSETGNTAKAGEQLARVEELQRKQVDEERKSIDPKLIKRLSIGEEFKNGGKDTTLPGLGAGLRSSVAGDLARSPRIQIIDTAHRGDVAKERDRFLAEHKDASPEEIEKLMQKEQAPQAVISGLYAVDGDSFSLSVEVHDLNNNLLASATEDGLKKDYGVIEKKVALKILDRLVTLTAEERAQLQKLEGLGSPNLDSFAYASAAQQAASEGDSRKATELFQRARETDQGNAKALVGLEKSLAEVEKKNQIAIPSPQTAGDVSEVEKEMFRRTLTDKLSGLKGLRVVEQGKVAEVNDELDRLSKDCDLAKGQCDNIDPKSLPLQEIGKKLAATVLVRSTMQKEGDHLSLSASLVDITDQKLLVGAAVDGPAANKQKLQADLAKQIVQRLRGEPTDEEKAGLEATMKEEDYSKKMAELSRLLEKEKQEKAATAARKAEEEKQKKLALNDEKPKQAVPTAAPEKLLAPKPASLLPTSKMENSWDYFSASVRASRVNPGGDDSKNMYGLLLTHYAQRSSILQRALLIDLESSRLRDRNGENHTAFYALGYDLSLPWQYKGNGLLFGASLNAGLAQLQRAQATSIDTSLAITLEPHAGIEFALGGVGLTGSLGYRLPFFLGSLSNDSTGLRGPYVQAGIKTQSLFEKDYGGSQAFVGYTAHMLVPNGNNIAKGYATTTKIGGGALWTHGLALGSRSEDTRSALYLGYGSQSAGSDSLSRLEASWQYLWSAFGPGHFFNPYLGFRLGGTLLKSDLLTSGSQKLGLLGALQAGLDFQFGRHLVLTAGGGYDAILGPDLGDQNSVSGYSLDLGATLRF